MKKFRRKYFQGLCRNCGNVEELVLTTNPEDDDIVWLRCSACSMMNDYPEARVLKTGRVLSEKEFEKRKKALNNVFEYNPQKTYWRGQKIKHTVLGDGEVVDKQKTNGDQKVIVVKFKKSGKKTLVEDYGVAHA